MHKALVFSIIPMAADILTLSKNVTEHGRTQRAVLVEDLVNDVPCVDLALVARRDSSDVVLDDRGQCGRVTDAGHPRRELGMPND